MKNMGQLYSNGAYTMRLIIGIFSILLSFIIGIQSLAAGLGEALFDPNSNGGAAGLILGFFMLAAGIIAIAARKTKGGTITSIVIYLLGGIVAAVNQSEIFGDLIVWTVVSFVFAVLLIISLFMKYKDKDNDTEHSKEDIIESIKSSLDDEESFNQHQTQHKGSQRSETVLVLTGFFMGMLFSIMIILIAAIVLMYTSEDKIRGFFADNNNSSAMIKDDSDKSNNKIAEVGETVENDTWKVTLRYAKRYTEIKSDDGIYTDKPSKDKNYLVLFFEAENISKKEDYFNPLYISAYEDGYSAEMKMLINKPDGEENIGGNVAPGKKTKGFVAFEVKPSWGNFEITYKDGITENADKLSFQINPGNLS